MISAEEFDRLGFLFRAPQPSRNVEEEGFGAAPSLNVMLPTENGIPQGRMRPGSSSGGDPGSPMDVCAPTAFADDGIATHTPFFSLTSTAEYAPADAVTAWLSDNVRLEPDGQGAERWCVGVTQGSWSRLNAHHLSILSDARKSCSCLLLLADVSMVSPPDSPGSVASSSVLGRAEAGSDVCGVLKASVVRGQDDVAPSGVLRVQDCHDAVIYALAPLQYALISCCRWGQDSQTNGACLLRHLRHLGVRSGEQWHSSHRHGTYMQIVHCRSSADVPFTLPLQRLHDHGGCRWPSAASGAVRARTGRGRMQGSMRVHLPRLHPVPGHQQPAAAHGRQQIPAARAAQRGLRGAA